MNWVSRLALYLSGVYLLFALLSPEAKKTDEGLSGKWIEAFRSDRRQFSALFANLLNALVYGKIITDKEGRPVDWVYLDVNDAFERMSGVKKERAIGRRVTEVFPNESKDATGWIGKIGQVALTGKAIQFESYRQSWGKWLNASVYSPHKGYFVLNL